jgi:hypothetical protein
MLAVMVLVTSTAVAAPTRKVTPDKFSSAAGDTFRRAMEAEDAGDLTLATALYKKSLALAVHPSTVYNLASIEGRDGKIEDAIADYEVYLALAPNASDASQVRAKLKELEQTPATVTVTFDPTADPTYAYVLADGAIVKRPGEAASTGKLEIKLARGTHIIELQSGVGSDAQRVSTVPGQVITVQLGESVARGNVAITGDAELTIEGVKSGHGRIKLAPGKRILHVFDGRWQCPSITVVAPATGDIAYVLVKPIGWRLSEGPKADGRACRKQQIVQQKLTFK